METIIVIAIVLTISLIFSEIFFRMQYPRVIGQILAGIIIGVPFIKAFFSADNLADIEFLSELGIVFLLLLAGLEINIKKLRKTSRDSLYIAFSSAIVPFVLGFGLMKVLGYSNLVSAVVGACLSITAEGTKLKVLMELKSLNTRVGTIMLGAAILDNIFEILFLALILMYIQQETLKLAMFPLMVMGFIILAFLILRFVPRIMCFVQKERSSIATISTMLVIGLIIASISYVMGLGAIIGAFIAGIIIQWANKNRADEEKNVKELQVMMFSFIVPFFFINIGLHLDFHSLFINPLLLLLVLVVAIVGKLLGSIITTPFSQLNLRQTTLVGWAMNSRGAVELVIAEIARINNLIPIEIYSVIVAMAVITTLIFPFVMKYYLRRYPDIMK
jgi:Kef-type K+ transport system membrane component KefB